MKRINELTEAELLALTDADAQNLIDYECALEGVPMLPPHPGPAPVKNAPPFDAKAFEVGGVLVLDSEHAGRILDAITSGPLYKIEYSSEHLVALREGDYDFPEIKTKAARSPEQWAEIKFDMGKYEAEKKEYDRLTKTYSDAMKERQSIIDTLRDAISDARERHYSREQLRSEFARYLELAEGNRQIALNFLDKAKGVILSKFPELREEFCPPQAAEAA